MKNLPIRLYQQDAYNPEINLIGPILPIHPQQISILEDLHSQINFIRQSTISNSKEKYIALYGLYYSFIDFAASGRESTKFIHEFKASNNYNTLVRTANESDKQQNETLMNAIDKILRATTQITTNIAPYEDGIVKLAKTNEVIETPSTTSNSNQSKANLKPSLYQTIFTSPFLIMRANAYAKEKVFGSQPLAKLIDNTIAQFNHAAKTNAFTEQVKVIISAIETIRHETQATYKTLYIRSTQANHTISPQELTDIEAECLNKINRVLYDSKIPDVHQTFLLNLSSLNTTKLNI